MQNAFAYECYLGAIRNMAPIIKEEEKILLTDYTRAKFNPTRQY